MYNKLVEIYAKNKEVILYLFFGGVSFIVSIGSYAFVAEVMNINELIANVISWILAVTFAFVTNRVWVFNAPTKTVGEFMKQATSFFGGRVFTLIVEELILLIFITILHFPGMLIKIIAQIIVIVLNYFISKFAIFKSK